MVAVAAGGAEHAERGEHRGEGEGEDLLEVQALDDAGHAERAAAVHQHRVLLGGVATAAQHVRQELAHVVGHQQMGLFAEVHQIGVEVPSYRLQSGAGGVHVERHVTAEEVVRIEVAEHHVAVGDGRVRPAKAPADI